MSIVSLSAKVRLQLAELNSTEPQFWTHSLDLLYFIVQRSRK